MYSFFGIWLNGIKGDVNYNYSLFLLCTILHYPPEREGIYSIQILVISDQNNWCHSHEDRNIKWNPVVDDDLLNVF